MAGTSKLSPLARLIHLFRKEKIRFQIAGMTAGILQGVPASTLDTDLWVDLPERQYVRVLALCQAQGARLLAKTVVALSDDTLVNFLYRIDGLKSFEVEYQKTRWIRWQKIKVAVLPLERLIRSKAFVARPKDLAHLPLLRQVLRASRKI